MSILLGHLCRNGDCMHASIVAHQIKHDFPNQKLTWAVSAACRGMVEGNPDIDEILTIPVHPKGEVYQWLEFETEARQWLKKGRYDKGFFTQIFPANFQNFDGTVRPSVFRNYGRPITVPVQPRLFLADKDTELAASFAGKHSLSSYKNVILFECSSRSQQSTVTPEYALEVARMILEKVPDSIVILSSNQSIATGNARIVDGSVLSMRETLALTHHCTLLLGCCSGISCMAMSTAAKPLPMIQAIVNSVYASIVHDYEYFKLPTDALLELHTPTAGHYAACAIAALTEGFAVARQRYHQTAVAEFSSYINTIDCLLSQTGMHPDAAHSVVITAERYGWHPSLRQYAKAKLLPNLLKMREKLNPQQVKELDSIVTALTPAHHAVKAAHTPTPQVEAEYQRAHSLLQEGKMVAALQSLEAVASTDAQHVQSRNDLGVLYFQEFIKFKNLALKHLSEAVRIDPTYHNALKNMADVTQELNRPKDAIALLNAVLSQNPSDEEAWISIKKFGNEVFISSLRDRRLQWAAEILQKPAQEAHELYSGDRWALTRKFIEEVQLASFALEEREAHFVREVAVRIQNSAVDERALWAAMIFQRPALVRWPSKLLEFQPAVSVEYLKFLLTPPGMAQENGEVDFFATYLEELLEFLHQQVITQKCTLSSELINVVSHISLMPLYFSTRPMEKACRLRSELLAHVLKKIGSPMEHRFPASSSEKKIRLGIFCMDFGNRTETFATLAAFENLPKSRFEITLFAQQHCADEMEIRCRMVADEFIELGNDLIKALNAIRSHNLDILLIGTNMSCVCNQAVLLASHRLARIQVAQFCCPSTTGLAHVDYFLVGERTEPAADAQAQYTEKLWRMPGSGIGFKMLPTGQIPTVFRSQAGLSMDAHVLMSGANFHKLTPELRETWVKILARDPLAVLLLYPFNPNWSRNYPAGALTAAFEKLCLKHGVKPERIKICPPVKTNVEVMARLTLADVYLDSFPYSGATSLIDPLELDIPLIVMDGTNLRTRQGAAMLEEAGLQSCIAHSVDDYIEKVVALSTDAERRAGLRQEIRDAKQKGLPFLNTQAYAEKIQQALEGMAARSGRKILEEVTA